MSSIVYDKPNQLPEGTAEARLALAGFDAVVIDLDLASDTGAGIRANDTGHLLIGKNRTVTGLTYGLDLTGHGSTIINEGTIGSSSQTGAAIRLTGVETYSVVNFGTITAAGIAIEGSAGVDRIINTGTLRTTSAVLLNLKGGDDFYDGILGSVNGGTIMLGGGNDTAYGGSGSEAFSGGEGDDHIDGRGGLDMVDYSEATGGVTVNLSRTTSQAIGGGQGSDTLIGIENLTGSAHNDMLVGSAESNLLTGREGNDTLEGGSGNDRLEGGTGNNTARYSGSSAAKVDLRIQVAQNTSGYGSDTLIGIANLEGGSGADQFIGNDDNNRLIGNGGNDTLEGGKGNDFLDGGSGQDTAVFSGVSAGYTIRPNDDGSVTILDSQGGQRDGSDTLKDVRFVKFSDQTIALTNGKPSYIYLSSSSLSEGTAVGVSVADISGSDPDGDKLTYSFASNPDGLFGLDSSGKEIILVKALDYEKATQHTISITAHDGYGGELIKTFTINVRNVVETIPLTRQGTARTESLSGESGNDRLSGLGGNDRLDGQIGNDILIGGTGNDTLLGGAGKDVFVFDQKLSAKSNRDYIQDFSVKDDAIHLARKIFSKLSKGPLSSKAFVIGDHFKDKDDRVLYHKASGALFYDPDGSGSAKAIQFANISKNLKMTYKDFYIV